MFSCVFTFLRISPLQVVRILWIRIVSKFSTILKDEKGFLGGAQDSKVVKQVCQIWVHVHWTAEQ